MKKQVLIIGLGQFGLSLAEALAREGVEILGVDVDPRITQAASALDIQAVSFDATDEDALARAAPANRDLCVCAIGGESREKAIMVTALLRQMGAKRIVARANDDLMERILTLVGAHHVINPEREIGTRLATRLLYEGFVDQVPLGSDLVITEMQPPALTVGRTLVELDLPKRFEIRVVATRRTIEGRGRIVMPNPHDPIREEDILVVVGSPDSIRRFMESD